jgi:hypothetical protein
MRFGIRAPPPRLQRDIMQGVAGHLRAIAVEQLPNDRVSGTPVQRRRVAPARLQHLHNLRERGIPLRQGPLIAPKFGNLLLRLQIQQVGVRTRPEQAEGDVGLALIAWLAGREEVVDARGPAQRVRIDVIDHQQDIRRLRPAVLAGEPVSLEDLEA